MTGGSIHPIELLRWLLRWSLQLVYSCYGGEIHTRAYTRVVYVFEGSSCQNGWAVQKNVDGQAWKAGVAFLPAPLCQFVSNFREGEE